MSPACATILLTVVYELIIPRLALHPRSGSRCGGIDGPDNMPTLRSKRDPKLLPGHTLPTNMAVNLAFHRPPSLPE